MVSSLQGKVCGFAIELYAYCDVKLRHLFICSMT